MASLDWSQCPAVESIPGKVSGAWVFKDTRMPVSIVFENLEAGATPAPVNASAGRCSSCLITAHLRPYATG
jgi:uncharacterized protein (DUF433 family)